MDKLYENQPAHIKRRIEFLLNEAMSSSPRDQVISFLMRTLSNYASLGFDGGSEAIKKKNRVVSKAAYLELLTTSQLKDWSSNTINEHPIPLKQTWSWLGSEAAKLSPSDVWNHFVEHPMVTILKSEDVQLNAKGHRSSNSLKRYVEAGIEIIYLDTDPVNIIGAKKTKCKK